MTLRLKALTGSTLEPVLDDVARVRMEVFRHWPYLYDGDLSYERRYLTTYRDSPGALIVGAFDGDRLIGASTGAPLEDHGDFAEAFKDSTLDLSEIFYCAESVLLPEYRGRGLGHQFFDLREAHARTLGRRYAAFCSVTRPEDHPARLANYRPLDAFWRRRGYAPLPGVVAHYSWRDVGDSQETVKPLQFWMREL